MSSKVEIALQISVAEYLVRRYPDVIFRSDLGGIRLTIGQAVQAKRLQGDKGRAYPDLFIAEPRKGYHGLFLELKGTRDDLYTKKGVMRKSEHIMEQVEILNALAQKGYMTGFVCGMDEAVQVLDWYLE